MAMTPVDYIAVSSLDSPAETVMAIPLSSREQRSLADSGTAKRRREVNVSRRLMAYGLREYLALSGDEVEWRESGPRYAAECDKVWLSIAHSRRHAAVAMSPNGAIGIDIETMASPPRWRRIMRVMFCDEDIDWITRNAGTLQNTSAGLRYFYIVWTAREAYAKYTGSSVFDTLSKPLLRDAREQAAFGGEHDLERGRVEVRVTEDRVVAVCRAPRPSMPVCMIGEPGIRNKAAPYRAEFVFDAGDSH